MRVVSVLRSGGDYTPAHVQALARQLGKQGVELQCLSDVAVLGVRCHALKHGWPGWWAKMELFRPDFHGDFLFMDLDTVIVDRLDDILAVRKLTLLRDFYRDGRALREGLQSSLMFLPEADREDVWEHFIKTPHACMAQHRGDQNLLERFYLKHAKRWQDVLPGQIVSWKVHCGGNLFRGVAPGAPLDARVIIMHGKPRPWEIPMFKELYE